MCQTQGPRAECSPRKLKKEHAYNEVCLKAYIDLKLQLKQCIRLDCILEPYFSSSGN